MQVLQLYAAHALSRSGGGGGSGGDGGSSVVEGVVQRLLAADEESWDTLLGEAASSEVGCAVIPVPFGAAQQSLCGTRQKPFQPPGC